MQFANLAAKILPTFYPFALRDDCAGSLGCITTFVPTVRLSPYVNLRNPDSWLTSHNCWTPFCLEEKSYGKVYNGATSSSHRSNGTMALINTPRNSVVFGLQSTDKLCPNSKIAKDALAPVVYCLTNSSFVEGFNIHTDVFPNAGGMLGFGTIYGLQTTLTPLIYQAYWSGEITSPVFSIWWNPAAGPNFLYVGAPPSVVSVATQLVVPLAARDGSWNFQANNLLFNNSATGANALAVLDLLDDYVTLPVAVGAVFAQLIGATTINIIGNDHYLISCAQIVNLPVITFVTPTGTLPLQPSDYLLISGPVCTLNIRGRNLFTPDGTPYWSLGMPLIKAYYTIYDFTLGLETITFNITGV